MTEYYVEYTWDDGFSMCRANRYFTNREEAYVFIQDTKNYFGKYYHLDKLTMTTTEYIIDDNQKRY